MMSTSPFTKKDHYAVYITRQLAIRDDAAMLDVCQSVQRHHQIVKAAYRDIAYTVP